MSGDDRHSDAKHSNEPQSNQQSSDETRSHSTIAGDDGAAQAWRSARYFDPEAAEQVDPSGPESHYERARDFDPDCVTAAPEEAEAPVVSRRPRRRWARLLGFSATAVLTLVVLLEFYRLIDWALTLHWFLGAIVLGLVALLLVSLGIQCWRSLKGIRQLGQMQALQTQAHQLLQSQGHGQAAPWLRALKLHARSHGTARELQTCLDQLDSAYSDQEIVRYVAQHGFTAQDAQARRCVQRYSIESGVMVAFSPWASFDMILVGWRNLRMLKDVAQIYGISPGVVAQAALLKQVLQTLAFSGLSELAIDAGTSALSSSLTTFSARAGQGLGAGVFTARTGLQAIRACRPVPAPGRDKRLLDNVASGVMERLKKQLKSAR